MRDESTPAVAAITPRNGVVALTGYGIRVAVERGHLIVEDGIGKERRCGRFSRVARDIKRLVVIGHTGTISFDALRWLHDIGASFVQIDANGEVIVASGPAGLDDARLRRAQAVAAFNGTGVALARELIREKLTGQAAVLASLPDTEAARSAIMRAIDALVGADSPDTLRVVEADAARAYWRAWEPMPLRFTRQDQERLPDHWRTFGPRSSLVSNGPRNATNPANAMLNYLYAIVEAEARIAALTLGLDPGIGMMHADQRGRDSLACDLMEAIRPQVDAFVLDMLTTRTFRARDFFENRQGVCRILPPLTQMLAETAPRWTAAIAPIAERVAYALFTGNATAKQPTRSRVAERGKSTGRSHERAPLPTLLTQMNRSAGRDGVRRGPKRTVEASSLVLQAACRMCGTSLVDRNRRYCDACLPEHEAEKLATLITSGPDALARKRAAGKDPTKTDEALQQQSERMSERRRAANEWEQEHGAEHDPEVFTRDILAKIQSVPLSALMEATGLSKRQCSRIRQGLSVPHMRHWVALGEVL